MTERLHFPFHFHALEKELAAHSSVLAWRIPRTGEPGGLPSVGSHRVGHDCSDSAAAAYPWPFNFILKLLNTLSRLRTFRYSLFSFFLCNPYSRFYSYYFVLKDGSHLKKSSYSPLNDKS